MTHALDFHNSRVAKNFVNDAVIADANPIGAFGTGEFFRTVRQWFLRQLLHFNYDAGTA